MTANQTDLHFLNSLVAEFHQNNAKPHMTARTEKRHLSVSLVIAAISSLQSKFAPASDFYLFHPHKVFLLGTKLSNYNEVKSIVRKWTKTQSKDFYAEGIQKFRFQ